MIETKPYKLSKKSLLILKVKYQEVEDKEETGTIKERETLKESH